MGAVRSCQGSTCPTAGIVFANGRTGTSPKESKQTVGKARRTIRPRKKKVVYRSRSCLVVTIGTEESV